MAAKKKTPTLASVLRLYGACPEAVAWAGPFGSDLRRGWMDCERGDWMLWFAVRVGLRVPAVLALCEMIRLSLRHDLAAMPRSAAGIETLEAWAIGNATVADVKRVANEAVDVGTDAIADAAYVASCAFSLEAAQFADDAFREALDDLVYWYGSRSAQIAKCLEIVRRHVTFDDLMAAINCGSYRQARGAAPATAGTISPEAAIRTVRGDV